MVGKGCSAEMIGECEGRWCKDPETDVTDERLLEACNWPEKLVVAVIELPTIKTMRSRVSCSIYDIAKG